MKKTLQKSSLKVQCVAAGALLGAAAFILLYGFAPLVFTNDEWLRGGYVEKDIIQHYAGWLFYRSSEWAFPLGIAGNFNYPYGGYVGLSDSIPLFAVLFKLLSPVLPATFQYFGLWGLLCSVMQGGCAALLLSLFTNSRLQNTLLSALFVFAPVFLDRQLRHGALGAQWLIILSLYFYFKHRRSGKTLSPAFPVLCALAMGIHPYFVPMVLAVQFALFIDGALRQKTKAAVLRGLASVGISVAAALAAGWVLGAFAQGAGAGSTTYGYFSMNLNAPFNPSGRGYLWSLFIPPLNQTLGNYDGFNYLGLGLIIVLAAAALHTVAKRRKNAFTQLKNGAGLAVVSLCLFVFAVSNVVTLFGRQIFTVPLPAKIISLATVLRSSGRMFYPVWYLLLLCGCVWVLRRVPAAKGKLSLRTAAVLALVAVQLIDLSPALAAKAAQLRPYTAQFESPMKSGFWQQAQGRYAHMASLDEAGLSEPIYPALWAADNGMTTNDTFTARFDKKTRPVDIFKSFEQLAYKTYDENTLYITSDEEKFFNLAEGFGSEMYCAFIDNLWYVFAPQPGAEYTKSEGDVLPEEYPLKILDYSDALWDEGVLTTDKRVVCFNDTVFTRTRIDGAKAVKASGQSYPVLEVSYKDAGWIMVTVDIEDAGVLRGKRLEFLK